MKKFKQWRQISKEIYINKSETFWIRKDSWLMLFPQVMFFWEANDRGRLAAITFEWLFWSMTFQLLKEE